MENIAQRLATRLLEVGAVKLSPEAPFTWASGLKSPIYCDNRLLLSYPNIRGELVEGFQEKALSFPDFGQIAGVATAGIAHGALLAHRLKLPFLYVRSKPKEHGRQNQIEGHLVPDLPVLVIEDLISTGGSSLKAVEALREGGAQVVGVMAIFSYGFREAIRRFQEANCLWETLTTYSVLLEQAAQLQYIQAKDLETLQQWRLDPTNWP